MIIPELPNYLTTLGGEDYKGFIIAIFTLTAGISRPFSGKLTDRVGRIPVMIIGAFVCFFVGFMYPLISSVAGFFLIRLIHGFSTGFKPTGTIAYVADIVPVNRRGEAMGISGFFGTTGMAIGPVIGSQVATHFSLDSMFYCSSALAITSILILIGMKETLPNPERFKLSHLHIDKDEIYDRDAFPPSLVMGFTLFCFGIVLTVIPDFSVHLGLAPENKGLFFGVFTIASLSVRIFAGKASDKYGRVKVLIFSSLGYMIGMTMIALSTNLWMFFAGAVVFGFGTGMNSPTLFAWTADLALEKHRGKALATVFIALELGIMLGAIISGWVYNNKSENFPITFFIGSLSAFIALVYLLMRLRRNKRMIST